MLPGTKRKARDQAEEDEAKKEGAAEAEEEEEVNKKMKRELDLNNLEGTHMAILQAYGKEKKLKPTGRKKTDLIKAIKKHLRR
jgi:hypothetical protein